ncbi:MAG: hypothetical protein RR405_04630 [Clostridia bacterium]
METIEMLINELDSEILKAKRAPFSNSDIVIGRNTLLDIVSRLRANYPAVISEAQQIKKDRDDILTKAEKYANDAMDKAEAQARALVAETEVVRQATEDAEKIRKEAKEYYENLDYQTRVFADGILKDTEKAMKEAFRSISDRRTKLIEE